MSSFNRGRMFFPGAHAFRVSERTRTIGVPPREVWRVVEDANQMPRWWPGVKRMEGVEHNRFTQVFETKRRRALRVDFRVLESVAPGIQVSAPGHRSWNQEVAGTPFERLLEESITEVVLEPVDGGTRVTVAQRQKLRGYSRSGTMMVRRATNKRLDQALLALERVVAEDGASRDETGAADGVSPEEPGAGRPRERP